MPARTTGSASAAAVTLPEPRLDGDLSVEAALLERRSRRSFARSPLNLQEVSQLLWAAQGFTDRQGGRTVPSAGALYPMEIYLAAGNVENLPAGVYRYRPRERKLIPNGKGDRRAGLAAAAWGQDWMKAAAAVVVIAGVYGRTTKKYGERGVRYTHMEVGHVAQNVYLQAVSLGLGTTIVGAFKDSEMKRLLGLRDNEEPLALLPVGRPG
jgi:SagB-type dehydrogenase family enzyme